MTFITKLLLPTLLGAGIGVVVSSAGQAPQCAELVIDGVHFGPVAQQAWDAAQQTIKSQAATISELRKEERNRVAIAENCAVWKTDQPIFTVLYDQGSPTLEISLLPMRGMPRVGIGPGAQMGPRWLFEGRVWPKAIDQNRKSVFYQWDPTLLWQGPFTPQPAN